MVTDPAHPSTAHLLPVFAHNDEWYDWLVHPSLNPNVHVLLSVDESTYTGGLMGSSHPIAWSQEPPGQGRSWYTALGHTLPQYTQAWFAQHLLGGILWAADSERTGSIVGSLGYGSASGTPPLAISWSVPTPSLGRVAVTGADPGASGIFGFGPCAASIVTGGLAILVDLGATPAPVLIPVVFDGSGAAVVDVPLALSLPASVGGSFFAQAGQLNPTIGLSGGLEIQVVF